MDQIVRLVLSGFCPMNGAEGKAIESTMEGPLGACTRVSATLSRACKMQ